MIINERVDRLTMRQSEHQRNGVGVSHLMNGLVAEWLAFTARMG